MNTLEKKNAIVLFAKAPVAGEVKTRLQPEVTPENSARLQEALIKDSILMISKINGVEKFLYFYPEEKRYMFEKLTDGLQFQLICQKGTDLGERMKVAFQYLFDKEFSRVVIIGADSPTLPESHINRAFIELNNTDVVLGPSTDGGYYLIGFKEKVFQIFSPVEWGSNKVLSQTEELIKKHKATLYLLPVHYDIDTIEDLRFLKTHLKLLACSGDDLPVNVMSILEGILDP